MIKINKGRTEFRGNAPILMAEFATIVHAMRYEIVPQMELDEEPEDTVMRLVKDGLKTEEELDAKFDKESKDLLKDILGKVLEKLEGSDE